jgi:hypothetical protein
MSMTRKCLVSCLAGAAMLAAVASSQGAVVVTLTTDRAPAGGSGPYTPAFTLPSNNLVAGQIATLSYYNANTSMATTGDNGTAESCRGPAAWTDGSLATTYATGTAAVDHAAYGDVDGYSGNFSELTYVTFNLGGLYNLTSADIYQGWNDSGRDSFSFTLQASADGITYTNVGTYTKGPDDTGVYTTPVTNDVNIADNAGGYIASGVEYVRLYVTDADNGYAGLAEVSISGTSVPEPTSLGLLSLGGLALLRRRSR